MNVLQVSVITFRKGNPISHRTLRFLLVCEVIGSHSRSRFTRELNILQVREEHYLGRDTTPQLQEAKVPPPLSPTFLSNIYASIPLSSRFPFAEDGLSLRPLYWRTSGANERTTSKPPCMHTTKFSCQWRSLRGTRGKINLVSTVDR